MFHWYSSQGDIAKCSCSITKQIRWERTSGDHLVQFPNQGRLKYNSLFRILTSCILNNFTDTESRATHSNPFQWRNILNGIFFLSYLSRISWVSFWAHFLSYFYWISLRRVWLHFLFSLQSHYGKIDLPLRLPFRNLNDFSSLSLFLYVIYYSTFSISVAFHWLYPWHVHSSCVLGSPDHDTLL